MLHFSTPRKTLSLSIAIVSCLLSFRQQSFAQSSSPVVGVTLRSNSLEVRAVGGGVSAIQVFAKAGGKFDDEKDGAGNTAGLIAASCSAAVIDAYAEAGGKFTAAIDRQGRAAAMFAVHDAAAIRAFVKAGGRLNDDADTGGHTVAMYAVWHGPETLKAFLQSGGRLTNQQDDEGNTVAIHAANMDHQRFPGLLEVFNAAVVAQGGLVTLNQYDAVKNGPTTIAAFHKSGHRFTEIPDQHDLTPAMIAASRGPDAISAFLKAGGKFSDWQNRDGFTVAMTAVISGADTIRAFTAGGGHFTDQQDRHGNTAAMWACTASDGTWPTARTRLYFGPPEVGTARLNVGSQAIEVFHAGGGSFGDQQDDHGQTAAMIALQNSPEAVLAFVRTGGHFTEQENSKGETAENIAAKSRLETMLAFRAAGGRFTDHQSSRGITSERVAAALIAEQITAFSKAGGVFTDRPGPDGLTSEMIALHGSDAFLREFAKKVEASGPSRGELTVYLEKMRTASIEAAEAYKQAIVRQGGLRHWQPSVPLQHQ